MPKQLSEATEGTTHMFPCWSPDGKTVAFIRGKMPDILSSMSAIEADIYTVPAGGGRPSALTTASDSVYFGPIAWSPDGTRIAYYSETDKAPSIGILKTVSASGEERAQIIGTVNKRYYDKEFAWSPDSKRIAFNGPDGKTISIMSVEDGSTVEIGTGLVNSDVGTQLDWSHDGARLVFVGGRGESYEFWMIEDLLPEAVGK
jgi:Tol biopolymer transport system component